MKATLALSLMLAVVAICTLQVHGNYGTNAGFNTAGPSNREKTHTKIVGNSQGNSNKGSINASNANKQQNSASKNNLDSSKTAQLEKDSNYEAKTAPPQVQTIVVKEKAPKIEYVKAPTY